MPKVARRVNRDVAVKVGAEVLARRGFNPIDKLIDLVEEEREMPDIGDPEAMAALMNGWLSDYEQGPGGKLRIRRGLALKALQELASYAYPKMKASETSDVNVGVQVVIEQPRALAGDSRRFEGRKGLGEGSVEVEVQRG